MRIYNSLIPPYQHIVDRIVAYTRLTDWHTCRAYLTSTYEALSRHGERFETIEPENDLAHMVTALIERIGAEVIHDREQAVVYAISADPEHRRMAEEWFTDHAEDFEQVWSQLRRNRMH